MTTPRRRDQTRFIFPLGSFDLPARPPAPPAPPEPAPELDEPEPEPEPVPGSNQLVHGPKCDDVSVPELATVYDDDQRPPGIDAEDEPDPPDEGE